MTDIATIKDRVLLETADLVVLNKPAGFEAVVTGGGNTRFCLRSILRRQLRCPLLEPVHRLDRDTTGCLLFSKSPELDERFEALFRGRRVHKEYLAICLGRPPRPAGTIRLALAKDQGGRRPVRATRGAGQFAETRYELVATAEFPAHGNRLLSLVRFWPLTGRTHQIRVHAAALGCPVLGDDQYGDRAANRAVRQLAGRPDSPSAGLNRQALHASKLALPDPRTGQPIRVEAPLPDDMRALLESCFRMKK